MQAEKIANKRIPSDILLNMVISYCVTHDPKTQQFKITIYVALDIESIIWGGLNWACFVYGLSYKSSDMAKAGHLPPSLGKFRQLGLEHLGSWNISLSLSLSLIFLARCLQGIYISYMVAQCPKRIVFNLAKEVMHHASCCFLFVWPVIEAYLVIGAVSENS